MHFWAKLLGEVDCQGLAWKSFLFRKEGKEGNKEEFRCNKHYLLYTGIVYLTILYPALYCT